MDARIHELAHGGYDDVVVMAPVAKLVPYAMSFAADNAVINVFAGVGLGYCADIQLRDLCRGIKIIGSSGSRISDLRKVLDMVERKELNTNLSIAAIGGLNAAREGLEAVNTARFPGKTVIYPQIPDLPLMSVEEVPERLPELKDKLGPHGPRRPNRRCWRNTSDGTVGRQARDRDRRRAGTRRGHCRTTRARRLFGDRVGPQRGFGRRDSR